MRIMLVAIMGLALMVPAPGSAQVLPGGDELPLDETISEILGQLLTGSPQGCTVTCEDLFGTDTCASGPCPKDWAPCCYCEDGFPLGSQAHCSCIKDGVCGG